MRKILEALSRSLGFYVRNLICIYDGKNLNRVYYLRFMKKYIVFFRKIILYCSKLTCFYVSLTSIKLIDNFVYYNLKDKQLYF